jgi:hypothetical protein
MNAWPFSRRESAVEVPSSPQPELREFATDFSSKNPFYDLANRLAWKLDTDPREMESLEDFIDRLTTEVVLDAKDLASVDKSVVKAKIPYPFSSEEGRYKYEILKCKADKLCDTISAVKTAEQRAKRKERDDEISKVKLQIESGLHLDFDSTLISSEMLKSLTESHKREMRSMAIDNIRAELKLGLEVKQVRSLVSDELLAELRDEDFQRRRNLQLSQVRSQLENNEPLQYDGAILTSNDVELLQSEVNDARNVWLRTRQRPMPQPYGVSNYGAEHLVASWLSYLGFENVGVTQASQDGGIDVISSNHACQVKNYASQSVSVQEVREIFGVATSMSKTGMIFTTSKLTPAALDFAFQVGVPAINFDVADGTLTALNSQGAALLESGCYE